MSKYLTLKINLLLFAIIGGCGEDNSADDAVFEEYTLDVSDVYDPLRPDAEFTAMVISPVAMALFPLDLSESYQKFSEMSENTIVEHQINTFCGGQETSIFIHDEYVSPKHAGAIRNISLELPYRPFYSENLDTTLLLKPSPCCVGYRHAKTQEWHWEYSNIEPDLNDSLQMGYINVQVAIKYADQVAILSENGMSINKIILEAKRVK